LDQIYLFGLNWMKFGSWMCKETKNECMWILPKLVDYVKSHMWSKKIVWINYAIKWVDGGTLSVYVREIWSNI